MPQAVKSVWRVRFPSISGTLHSRSPVHSRSRRLLSRTQDLAQAFNALARVDFSDDALLHILTSAVVAAAPAAPGGADLVASLSGGWTGPGGAGRGRAAEWTAQHLATVAAGAARLAAARTGREAAPAADEARTGTPTEGAAGPAPPPAGVSAGRVLDWAARRVVALPPDAFQGAGGAQVPSHAWRVHLVKFYL